MTYSVGAKGQVVIDKSIRDRLGVLPGWQAVQKLVGDRVEIRFIGPEHNRSLAGCLAKHVERSAPNAEALRHAREAAWANAAGDRQRPREAAEGDES